MELAGGVATVTENQQSAVGGELVTTDDDRHEKFTYSLVSDGGGPFDIVGKEVRLKSGASVDYEKNKQFSIRIKVTDGGSPAMSLTKTFMVKIIDVNEAPTNVYLSKYEVCLSTCTVERIGVNAVDSRSMKIVIWVQK